MLAEISEATATGEIAAIFEDVRRLWGVPYVSAIHRHLATRPGVLEWAWAAVSPVFRSGEAQTAAWDCAAGLALSPLDPVPRDALAVWRVGDRDLETIKAVAAGFERVAPVNMMFAALVKALLQGQSPGGASPLASTWLPPKPLPAPPAMVDAAALDSAARGVLMRFATTSDGKPFVPGLYRMLGHWPAYLAHLATVLAPRLAAAETLTACDELRRRIDSRMPGVLAILPPIETRHAMPSADERAHFLAIGGTYRKTSPELVVLGRLIKDALP